MGGFACPACLHDRHDVCFGDYCNCDVKNCTHGENAEAIRFRSGLFEPTVTQDD